MRLGSLVALATIMAMWAPTANAQYTDWGAADPTIPGKIAGASAQAAAEGLALRQQRETLAQTGQSQYEQRPQPTDTDMRAFYCSPVIQFMDTTMHQVPRPSSEALAADPKLAASVQHNDNAIQRLDGELSRVSSYVAVRLTQVDVTMAAMALKSGQDDVSFLESQVGHDPCGNVITPETMACSKQQLEENGVGPRLARCSDLSWLPF
jgi:hypothetical protein